jgi:redox-sensitive bicupin YhaK (pirin superfamily)
MREKIKKKIRFSLHSQCEWLGEIKAQQVLPNKFAQAIGPFIFLEHILSCKQSSSESDKRLAGKHSHPFRGVATLTYILSGEVEHFDSIGNNVNLVSGGAHWTKAGKGIVHDEVVKSDCRTIEPDIAVLRFWINLPSKAKTEEPGYVALRLTDIPKCNLPDDAGWIKIISGGYQNTISKIPCYSKEFLYHIHLEPGKQFSTTTEKALEYAAFLPANKAKINGMGIQAGEFIAFNGLGEIIEITSNSDKEIDIILFGGEPYNEPIVTDEKFVMNTPHEITQAYNDYYDGKYGQIKTQ